MDRFYSFVKKETLHILRDPRTMLILIIMPIVQVLLFGFAMSTDVNNVDLAVVAPHRTEAIRKMVERFSANQYFTFKGYIAGNAIDEELRTGAADAVAIFDENKGMQIILDASNPNTATAGAAYLQGIMMSDSKTPMKVETHILYNPQMKSSYNFVPGIMGMIFIIICAMMTSVSIVREKETGTMEVLLVSPSRPLGIIFAKMVPYFILSCLNLATILLLARFVLDVPMSGNISGIIGISLLYLLLALSFGLLISTFAKDQATALIISGMLLLMPIIMLSGLAFPIENMPGILQVLSCIVPTRWYISAVRKLMIEGLPFVAVMNEFWILFGMTTVILLLALKNYKEKLE
jgi:ABC-2 type transport system permease protein